MFLKDILLKIKDYLFPGIFLILIFGSFAQAQTISNLNINDVNRPEGNAGTTSFQFTISLSQINDQDVTVQVDTLDGSATSAGNDYTPITAQIITIPANTVSQTVTVNVTGDTQFEPDETFFVLLSSPSPNAVLDDGQGQGTIVNDDALPAVTLSLTGSPMAEAGGSATVTADLSFITGDAVTVDLDFSGTASNATDYNASGNQIVIPAGSASGTITLTAVEDDLDEIDETVIVSISNVVNAIEAGQQAVVATIADNDSPPEITLSLSGSPLAEAGAAATVTAMLAAASTLPVTVDLGFSGTAVNTSDYNTSGNQIVITPGSISGSITLTSLEDAIVEGDETIVVDVTGVINTSETTPQQVTATITDNDSAGFNISETDGATEVSEPATTDLFSVVLTAQPLTDVVITLSASDPGEAAVTPAALTFTDANWNIPQEVTVSAVDDNLADGDVASSITLSVDNTVSNSAFAAVADRTVSVITADDEIAGFTLTPSDGGTMVSETGTTDTFSIVLNAQPDGFVVLNISSDDPGEVILTSPAFVLFSSANWDIPQTVTVQGIDDNIIDGDQTTQIIVAVDPGSAALFAALPAQALAAVTTDDDQATISVNPTGGLTTTEDGGTAVFDVVLSAAPQFAVTIPVSSDNPAEGTVSPAALSFTAENWDVPQTVTVTGVDDAIIDGDVVYTIVLAAAVSADINYAGQDPDDVSVVNTDNDTAGFNVTETDGNTQATEGGPTDNFSVVLNTQPLNDVVLTITSGDVNEATVSVPSVTFTTANWNVPRTITVTAVDDTAADGNRIVPITIAVDTASSDASFAAVPEQIINATTIDNDSATLMLTLNQVLVSEGVGTVTATLSRNTDTTNALLVQVLSSDPAGVTVPALVTIPAATDSLDFTVTVVDDQLVEDLQTVTVTATSPGFADANADLTIIDNDFPTLTLTIDPASISENGGLASATLTRNTPTTEALSVTLASSDTTEATVPATVVIAAGSDSAVFDITAVDDALVDGTQTVTVSASAAGFIPGSTTLDVSDDDTAQLTLTINPASISENGGFSLATLSRNDSVGELVVTLTSSDPSETTVPTTVTLADGQSATAFVISAVDDELADGPQTVTITASAAGFDDLTVTIEITDDDIAQLTLVISQASAGEGSIVSATVSRNSVITALLTVTLTSSDVSEATVPATVDIPAGADSATFDITTVNDGVIDGIQTVTITASAADFTDGSDTLDIVDVVIPNLTLTLDPDSISEAAGLGAVTGTVSRDSDTVGDLIVNLTSDDDSAASVPSTPVTILDGEVSATFLIDINDDDIIDGDQLVTISAAASGLNDTSAILTVTDNEAAGFTLTETDGGTMVSETGTTDTFDVVLNGPPQAVVVVNVASGDTDEVEVSSLSQLIFTGANWDLPQTVTVAGVDDIIVDGDQTTPVIVSIDAGLSDVEFTVLPAQTVQVVTTDDDTAGISVNPTDGLTTTEAGGTAVFDVVLNTQPQTPVQIVLSSSDSGEGTITPNALTFTAADWDITQTVTVTGVDDFEVDGPVTYTIVLDPAISADPAYVNVDPADVTVINSDNDSAGFSVSESNGNTQATEGGATDSIGVVLNTQPSTDVVLLVASSDPAELALSSDSLTFTPANWNVTQTVTVIAVDDAAADGNQTVDITFAVDATGSDDNFDALADQIITATTIDNDSAALSLTVSPLAINENGSITATATLSRNTGTTGGLNVLLQSSDETEAIVPGGILLPDGSDSVTFAVTAVDDGEVDGVQEVMITATAPGFTDATTRLVVVDDDLGSVPTLTLVLQETSINENGGGSNATVTRNGETTAALTVNLVSSNSNEATVPATVTIAAGANSATFIVSAVNDAIANGDQTVTITATATGFVSGIDTLSVLDDDVPALSLSIAQTSISENGGISLASVSRNSNAGNPLTLNLLSSDTSEAIVSATVTIAAGQTNSAFLINAVNDNELDGTQTVTITASATGFAAVDGTIAVTDDDTGGVGAIQLTLTIAPASISENGGTATATVTRTGATVAALTVNLVSNDPGEATVPASVEIAAGETSATATVTAVDDAIADGIQTVTITASATGASDVNASVNVTDDEGGTTPDAIFSNDFED